MMMQTYYISEYDMDTGAHHITGWISALNETYAYLEAEHTGFHPSACFTRQEIEEGTDEDLKEQLECWDAMHS